MVVVVVVVVVVMMMVMTVNCIEGCDSNGGDIGGFWNTWAWLGLMVMVVVVVIVLVGVMVVVVACCGGSCGPLRGVFCMYFIKGLGLAAAGVWEGVRG